METTLDPTTRRTQHPIRRKRLIVLTVLLLALLALGYAIAYFLRDAKWQAETLARIAREVTFKVEPGSNAAMHYPITGPYDIQLGYTALPSDITWLSTKGFFITEQARQSERFAQIFDHGIYPPYVEKAQAGLMILDCEGRSLYQARYPQRVYRNFDALSPLLVQSLLFIEDRDLLDPAHPTRNPAMDWTRLSKALAERVQYTVWHQHASPGGSTLVTQIAKYRHSPEGRTGSVEEKFRQMAAGSLRAYRTGPDTTEERRQIAMDYLNTVPLSAKAGYGAVNGIGDGMWAWYGRDFDDVNRLLAPNATAPLAERALAYKQALSLLISQRRPSYYLLNSRAPLEAMTNSHLRLLTDAGVITPELRDAALAQPLSLNRKRIEPPPPSFITMKAANATRSRLANLLRTPQRYELDRRDLTVTSTIDQNAQNAFTQALRDLHDPENAQAAGLIGPHMLDHGDPAGISYSLTLVERVNGINVVRVNTDNRDQPFDINQGTKLDLGSTAKLRTLLTYLDIIDNLHQQYSTLTPEELKAQDISPQDILGRWARDYLLSATDKSLMTMLNAAMDRTYSGSTGEAFFTGGGVQHFANFTKSEDSRIFTVREALQDSVNLAFVRLMRDIAHHYMFLVPGSTAKLLENPDDPRRQDYLERFADREGRVFINRFYPKYHGLTPEAIDDTLLRSVHPSPERLTAAYLTLVPNASIEQLNAMLIRYLPNTNPSAKEAQRYYDKFKRSNWDLPDLGYLARLHPLELWVAAYLRQHPEATLTQTTVESTAQRQEVYAWLFKTQHKNAQDTRIKQLIEVEAFLEIHKQWKRMGYPFDFLVPSYATALGASADRPAALAEVMGILVNDGMRVPTVYLDKLHFAANTPFETEMKRQDIPGERVLAPEVTQVARDALTLVVAKGTARRLSGALVHADGSPMVFGGKTGTGDHRFKTFGKGGAILDSRAVSRSGTFVFFIDSRYFGTLTAYVDGPKAGSYGFSSSLPLQIIKTLAPTLNNYVDSTNASRQVCHSSNPVVNTAALLPLIAAQPTANLIPNEVQQALASLPPAGIATPLPVQHLAPHPKAAQAKLVDDATDE